MSEERKEKESEISDVKEEKEEQEKTSEDPMEDGKKNEKKCKKEIADLRKAAAELKEKVVGLEKSAADSADKYLRLAAEYKNFRERSTKEKEGIYADAYADALKSILPVIDNLELAVEHGSSDPTKIVEGVQMTLKQFKDTLNKLGVEMIPTEKFDPNLHNAVMHVEDENAGEGTILEVFQKGYKKGDKVIRYAMVKVAN
jgi:molecular chaperone GrpE